MNEYIQSIPSGTVVHLNIFRLGLFRVFSDKRFARNNYLTELSSPISAVHFSFASIFHYLTIVQFARIPNLSFSLVVVYNGEHRLSISVFILEK